MKKLLLLLIIPFLAFGQNKNLNIIDLNNRLNAQAQENKDLNEQIQILKYKMDKHHGEYMTGASIVILGTTLSALSIATNAFNAEDQLFMLRLGSITNLIGSGLMLYSNRWFGLGRRDKHISDEINNHLDSVFLNTNLNESNYDKDYVGDFSEIICECNILLKKGEVLSQKCQAAVIAYKINTPKGKTKWEEMLLNLNCE
ncbi:MAG: hypothetical protein CMD26_05450 [Flavobacteriales bacterium]|nr:hypothetical protein [Flavobacteriales bacterium]